MCFFLFLFLCRGSGVDAVPKADPDGSAVWVDFAKSPVAESANPGNVTIVEDFSPGSAVWATK